MGQIRARPGSAQRRDRLTKCCRARQRCCGGEVWIPRDVLVRAATESDRHGSVALEQSGLTTREMEILNLVSTGATNDQIAAQLCISPHTVKTHMYNIFRKIGVDNRFRAAPWVRRNMGTPPTGVDPSGLAAAAGQ